MSKEHYDMPILRLKYGSERTIYFEQKDGETLKFLREILKQIGEDNYYIANLSNEYRSRISKAVFLSAVSRVDGNRSPFIIQFKDARDAMRVKLAM